MKKILLLLCFVSGFIGFSSATLFSTNSYSSTFATDSSNATWVGGSIFCSLPSCSLVSGSITYANATPDCKDWIVITYTGGIVGSGHTNTGYYFDFGGLNIPSNQLLYILVGSGKYGVVHDTCNHKSHAPGSLTQPTFPMGTGFYSTPSTYTKNATGDTVGFGTTPRMYFSAMTYSGVVYGPINVRYNGTSGSFLGSNIYLNGQYRFSLSGSDWLFNANTFRTLLRSH